VPPAEPSPSGGYYGKPRPEMLAFVPTSARRVLDVGCGSGRFGAELKRMRGARVWGIECVPEAARQAEGRLDGVVTGDVLEALEQLPPEPFDCIVCNDVLEHLVDPEQALLRMGKRLASGGVIVASIPNVRHFRVLRDLLFHKQWRYRDDGVLDRTHLRFFTERSIRDTFERLGFEVLRLEGINASPKRLPRLLSLLTLGWLRDLRFLQFACVARPGADPAGEHAAP
jgi:2-polyprenyl-3-methyl-5-hydroxy-6-metoxy-1,4-benzoquinol methylase